MAPETGHRAGPVSPPAESEHRFQHALASTRPVFRRDTPRRGKAGNKALVTLRGLGGSPGPRSCVIYATGSPTCGEHAGTEEEVKVPPYLCLERSRQL